MCTLHTQHANPAQNVYCVTLTDVMIVPGDPCASVRAVGCCTSNQIAKETVYSPAQAQAMRDAIALTCGIDTGTITPCQPPAWANVTFAGLIVTIVDIYDVNAKSVVASC